MDGGRDRNSLGKLGAASSRGTACPHISTIIPSGVVDGGLAFELMARQIPASRFDKRKCSTEAVVSDPPDHHRCRDGRAQIAGARLRVAGRAIAARPALARLFRRINCEQADAFISAAQGIAVNDSALRDRFSRRKFWCCQAAPTRSCQGQHKQDRKSTMPCHYARSSTST